MSKRETVRIYPEPQTVFDVGVRIERERERVSHYNSEVQVEDDNTMGVHPPFSRTVVDHVSHEPPLIVVTIHRW
jgi:hypothetical protein